MVKIRYVPKLVDLELLQTSSRSQDILLNDNQNFALSCSHLSHRNVIFLTLHPVTVT